MVSVFSGVGMQERGIINSDLFDVDVLATSDIDKEAIVSYAAVHNGLNRKMIEEYSCYPSREEMAEELKSKNIGYDFKKEKIYDWGRLSRRKDKSLEKYWLADRLSGNMGDVRVIKSLPKCDLLTFSFPCQSISIAGRQEGIIEGKTRSGLVYEIVRLIKEAKESNTLPKYLLLENVAALISKKFIGDFDNLNTFFDEMGYNVYWSLINGKDCGVPQNRNRCFAVYIRKDIDTGKFTFPKPFDNGVRLKDILESEVDARYYLSDKVTRNFKLFSNVKGSVVKAAGTLNPQKNVQDKVRVLDTSGMSQGLRATDYKSPVKILSAGLNDGCHENKIEQIGIIHSGKSAWKNPQTGRVYLSAGCSPTLICCGGGGREPKILEYTEAMRKEEKRSQFHIRKLTPKECWRLMGLSDSDYDKASDIGVADTHLYKQAGNGIITNCVALLAEHLYKAQYDDTYTCTDEKFSVTAREAEFSRGDKLILADTSEEIPCKETYIERKYREFYKRNGYIPQFFVPYNGFNL